MAFPKIDGYVVTEKLGSGSYSTVYKARTKVGAKSIVAIKCVDKSKVKHSGSAVDNLITEIRLLKKLTHPHIVHMKNFTWDDRNIYIIMEYCCGGDLSRYIHRYGRVPEKQVLYFLQQLASALKFLREKGVVHMDLKPHNLLLHKGSDGKYILKVADFGFAQHMTSESMRSVRGSPLYMAPEMICGEYDARVDLWSVGVIMYECLFGRAPYSSSTFKQLVDKIQRQAPIEIPPNSSISAGCLDLLTRLLQHHPDNRISYEDFFDHQYLDLEHMPSKENYDKAVCVMKRAVECDAAGARAGEAFALYREGLRLLVPRVAAEADPLRRAALADKLTRYMERAEELKLQLKGGGSQSRDIIAQSNAPPTVHNSNHDNNIPQPMDNRCQCNVNDSNTAGACACACDRDTDTQVNKPEREETIEEDSATGQPGRAEGGGAGGGGGGGQAGRSTSRFAFKRFFTRQASLPSLEARDPSIAAESTKTEPIPENDDEGCRIH